MMTKYEEILFRIAEIIDQEGSFHSDKAFDGTYNFCINDVAILFKLMNIIETISSTNNNTIIINRELKKFRFEHNSIVYDVNRMFALNESSIIITPHIKEFVSERELLKYLETESRV